VPRFVRVRDRRSGHEFDINPEAMGEHHEPLNDPAWPDLDAPSDTGRLPVYAAKPAPAPPTPAASARRAPAPTTTEE